MVDIQAAQAYLCACAATYSVALERLESCTKGSVAQRVAINRLEECRQDLAKAAVKYTAAWLPTLTEKF